MNSYVLILKKKKTISPILSYDSVRNYKYGNRSRIDRDIKGVRGDDSEIFMFDGIRGCVICKLPIHEKYLDFVIESDGRGFLLCEEPMPVPGRYSDEVDDTEVLFFAEVTWGNDNLHASIERSISLYIDNNYDCADKLSYGENLRFPLFDQYLWEWLDQKSFSSNGKYVIYYSKDIKGIIIGNPVGGRYIELFLCPKKLQIVKVVIATTMLLRNYLLLLNPMKSKGMFFVAIPKKQFRI